MRNSQTRENNSPDEAIGLVSLVAEWLDEDYTVAVDRLLIDK